MDKITEWKDKTQMMSILFFSFFWPGGLHVYNSKTHTKTDSSERPENIKDVLTKVQGLEKVKKEERKVQCQASNMLQFGDL